VIDFATGRTGGEKSHQVPPAGRDLLSAKSNFSACHFFASRPNLPSTSYLPNHRDLRDFAVSRFRDKKANQFPALIQRFPRRFSMPHQTPHSTHKKYFPR
jgi:hypothetical protein